MAEMRLAPPERVIYSFFAQEEPLSQLARFFDFSQELSSEARKRQSFPICVATISPLRAIRCSVFG